MQAAKEMTRGIRQDRRAPRPSVKEFEGRVAHRRAEIKAYVPSVAIGCTLGAAFGARLLGLW